MAGRHLGLDGQGELTQPPTLPPLPEERAERIALRRTLIGSVVRGRTVDIVQQILSQGSDALQIQIFGRDLNKLYALAVGVIPQIAALPGVLRPDTNYTPATPELDIKIDRRRAAQHGFSTDASF